MSKVKSSGGAQKVYSWWQHVAFKETGYVFAEPVAAYFLRQKAVVFGIWMTVAD